MHVATEAHKRRVAELHSQLGYADLEVAQMENRAISNAMDNLHAEAGRERAANTMLKEQLKDLGDELTRALADTNRLAVEVAVATQAVT